MDNVSVIKHFNEDRSVITAEFHYVNGLLHSVDGSPSVIERSPKTGKDVSHIWHYKGRVHGTPAIVKYDENNGEVLRKMNFHMGLPEGAIGSYRPGSI